VIGFLSSITLYPPTLDAFRQGLADEGFVEGKNVAIEYRWAEGRYERLPTLASELVARRVDVIFSGGGTVTARAAKLATNTIPIVFVLGGDPVAAGFVTSLGRPGGNLTGVAQLVSEAGAKRVELMHDLLPEVRTFGLLENPSLPATERQTRMTEAAAAALGIKVVVVGASDEASLATAFATLARAKIRGLIALPDPFFFMARNEIVRLAAAAALPTMYFFRDFVTAGGLMSYGTRLDEANRQAGVYIGRILKGARPADLPIIQQSEKIELLINLKAAKALPLTIPQSLLLRADEVIE
jgi:putative ABC transport system substrate-binding protein